MSARPRALRNRFARLMTQVALRQADHPVARSRAQWLECLGVEVEELADYRKGRRALSEMRVGRLPDARAAAWLDRDFVAAFEVGPEEYHPVRLALVSRIAGADAAAKLTAAYAPTIGEFTYSHPKGDPRDLLALELLTLRQFEADGHIGIRARYHAHWVVRQLLDHLAQAFCAFAPSATAVSAFVINHHFADRRTFTVPSPRPDWVGQPCAEEVDRLYTPAWCNCAPIGCTGYVAPVLRTRADSPRPVGAQVASGVGRTRIPDPRLTRVVGSVDGRRVTAGNLPAIGLTLRRAADAAIQALVANGRCTSSEDFWCAFYCDRHQRRQAAGSSSRISPARVAAMEARYPEVARWLRRPLVDAAERRRRRLFENAAVILRRGAGERTVEPSLLWLAHNDLRIEDPVDALTFALLRMDAASAVRHWISFCCARHRFDAAVEQLRAEPPFEAIAEQFVTYVDARFCGEYANARARLGGSLASTGRRNTHHADV